MDVEELKLAVQQEVLPVLEAMAGQQHDTFAALRGAPRMGHVANSTPPRHG